MGKVLVKKPHAPLVLRVDIDAIISMYGIRQDTLIEIELLIRRIERGPGLIRRMRTLDSWYDKIADIQMERTKRSSFLGERIMARKLGE